MKSAKMVLVAALAMAALGLAGCQQFRDHWTEPGSDAAIAAMANQRILSDTLLGDVALSVQVESGTATVHGTVGSSAQRVRALMLVDGTEGVVEVIDEITVR